jgi:hypothetical protein
MVTSGIAFGRPFVCPAETSPNPHAMPAGVDIEPTAGVYFAA